MSKAVDIIRTSYYINGPWRDRTNFGCFMCQLWGLHVFIQEGQHPLTGQRAANFRLLADQ